MAMNILTQIIENNWCQVFGARPASFGHVGVSSVTLTFFSKIPLNVYKGPENINYTIMMYGETFYDCYMALTPIVVNIYSK